MYHARVPPAALFVLAQNVATFVEAFLAIDALAWPAGAVGVVSKRLVRKNEKKSLPVPVSFTIIGNHAGVAELADAYGSGPYGGNPVKVQVLSHPGQARAGDLGGCDRSARAHARRRVRPPDGE